MIHARESRDSLGLSPDGGAESHLSAIVESSDDAIVSKDLDGIVRSWNPAAERIFGYSADEMIGQSIRRIIPADLQDEEDEVLARIRAGGRVDHFETIRRRKDGSLVPISLTVSPVRNAQGQVVGASKIARDITQQRAAEEAVQASMALKDQFLALVSHELRTPISAVIGNAQLLSRRWDRLPDERRSQALVDIADEAGRLQHIVEDLLELTRLNAGEVVPLVPVNLIAVVEDVLRGARSTSPARPFSLDVSTDMPLVAADETLLRLVLRNLLSNAAKYSPSRAPIDLVLSGNEAGAEVSVLDRGSGIDAGELERIFEPFYRTTSARAEAPGMGLGLAITRRALDAQGGWITAAARPGGGAAFTFGLAAAGAHDHPSPPHPA